ncbi:MULTISPECIES: hypothetical protein [Vibrio]|uniref:hypothetical protein n=1 Tax=Vibrio TaxID=662 RepID=UPI00034B5239|nr:MULTISPECIES: hypothetical protein [Vibrio]HDY7429463.1 hypothetical protein [Vibrio vulnificus]HDY7951972.1 hypothetical protein [Vibrio vulnificus]HDZ5419767.1 hypothetical protein [Vibrio harveyi]
MENKTLDLDAANKKLSELMKELKSLERDYDDALTLSADNLGNDDRIEQFRDDKVMEALQRVQRVKVEVASQVELVA